MRKSYAILGVGVATVAVAALVSVAMYSAQADRAGPSGAGPRVVIKHPERDLGVIDPTDKCSSTFIIYNEGSEPLHITKAGTSCKCTVSVVPARDIPPGMAGPIEIESKTEGIEGPFSHIAAFRTNDPQQPDFEVRIEGEIRRYVAAMPHSIRLSDLKPGKPVELSAMILSDVWDEFSLENVTSTIDGLKWEFTPATPEQLAANEAKSGYEARFSVPGGQPSSKFSGWVEAEAMPTGLQAARIQGEARRVRVTLAGKCESIRGVYGHQVDAEGVVHLGVLKRGQGARAKLLLKVRGEHRELNIRSIESTPDYLDVKVFAPSPEFKKKGLYNIIVELPPDAPAGSHVDPDSMGTLHVLTDHPEMPEIVALKVAFVILSE